MQVLIRYTVRREELAAHLAQVREVYADLKRRQPAGIEYATYQLEDPVGFLEVLSGDAGPGPLAASPAFQRFRADLDARCEHLPVLTEMRTVGCYPATTPSPHAARVIERGQA